MEPDHPDHPPLGLIGNLFNTILDSCANVCQRLTSTEQSRRLRSESERFFLWGDGVSVADGQLDKSLVASSELYQTTLSALYELGKVINDGLTQVVAPSEQPNPPTDTRELQLLLIEAGPILAVPNARGDSEGLSDDENGPHSLEDVLDDMVTYIDCLMDLSPALESTLAYPESGSIEPAVVELGEMVSTHTGSTPPHSIISSYRSLGMRTLSSTTMPDDGNAIDLGIDDGSLPGPQAAITLFGGTSRERVVHLGPWEVQELNPRRVIWQGTYQNEVLEHHFPSNEPSDVHPHTLHTRHHPYYHSEPVDTERYVTFLEPHRIRYINNEGVCMHDEFINVKYEFTSVESSILFQGDLRRKELIDSYDTDVVWTNINRHTDSSGNIKGVATIQRLKLWRDRWTGLYSLSIHQNKVDRQYRDYILGDFQREIRHRDDRANQLQLEALREDGDNGRRPITTNQLQQFRRRSSEASESRLPIRSTDSIRYLAIKFSERTAYRRFIETWETLRNLDSLPNQLQLPSRMILSRHLTREQPQGGIMNLSPGPPDFVDAAGSSTWRE